MNENDDVISVRLITYYLALMVMILMYLMMMIKSNDACNWAFSLPWLTYHLNITTYLAVCLIDLYRGADEG